jgi:hypothetical protein
MIGRRQTLHSRACTSVRGCSTDLVQTYTLVHGKLCTLPAVTACGRASTLDLIDTNKHVKMHDASAAHGPAHVFQLLQTSSAVGDRRRANPTKKYYCCCCCCSGTAHACRCSHCKHLVRVHNKELKKSRTPVKFPESKSFFLMLLTILQQTTTKIQRHNTAATRQRFRSCGVRRTTMWQPTLHCAAHWMLLGAVYAALASTCTIATSAGTVYSATHSMICGAYACDASQCGTLNLGSACILLCHLFKHMYNLVSLRGSLHV